MSESGSIQRFLSLIGDGYRRKGYNYIAYPSQDLLPTFMQGFRPHAIALSDAKNIAIQVIPRGGPTQSDEMANTQTLFKGRTDWEFRVFSAEAAIEDQIFAPTRAQIEAQLADVESLLASGQARAALLMAWSAIEAVARKTGADYPLTYRSPSEALHALAHMGFLENARVAALMELLRLRNRVAHGDLTVPVRPEEVRPVLDAARTALLEAA
mgnify:CR=1 FL=1